MLERVVRLILVRHAKSSWDSDAASDHDRPLNKRGRRDAPLVAQRLIDLGWVPTEVRASDSARTRETWALFEEAGLVEAGSTPVAFLRDLYESGPSPIMQVITDAVASGGSPTVMVIGHNPTLEQVFECLVGEERRVTTCNALLIEGRLADSGSKPLGWADVAWSEIDHIQPRKLADA